MKILVCLKQILDPEIAPRDFQIDAERLEPARAGANLVTNIFCENALEMALQLRDTNGGEITAISYGPESADEVLRKALALNVDHAFRVDNPRDDRSSSDVAACVLAAAVRKLGQFDLVLVGREAGDWGEGRTGALLAEHLALPMLSLVDQIGAPVSAEADSAGSNRNVTVQRQTDFGREQVEAQLPLVLTITNNDANVPRIPKTRDIMKAHRKQLTTWSLADIGLDDEALDERQSATSVVGLALPDKTTECQFIDGDSTEEKIAAFAEKISDVLRRV